MPLTDLLKCGCFCPKRSKNTEEKVPLISENITLDEVPLQNSTENNGESQDKMRIAESLKSVENQKNKNLQSILQSAMEILEKNQYKGLDYEFDAKKGFKTFISNDILKPYDIKNQLLQKIQQDHPELMKLIAKQMNDKSDDSSDDDTQSYQGPAAGP